MRRYIQRLRLRGGQLLLAAMLCGVCRAAPIPDATLEKMRAAVAECVAQRMSPDQICLRMHAKFGYTVYARSVFGDKGTDILVQSGDGPNITFLTTIGRVPYCSAARGCPG
ncbi:hypothetical protein [Duganella vulcania]|uniref:Uncharacterized protein n=1 Tax=Duganella vulcania TaxID=2692166 RepID=A0A845GS17_9BURK|nr:hypothetical protein [Duganella vulcania]MYM97313.1 hypothetical protein [Duganella vulcania]